MSAHKLRTLKLLMAFRAEIPAFVAEIKTIFERWQLAPCLEKARVTGPFDPGLYDNAETIEMEQHSNVRRCVAPSAFGRAGEGVVAGGKRE